LHLKDKRREEASRQEDEERYRKKRKEREYERLSYEDYNERDSRSYSSRASESAREYQERSIRPLPSSSSSRQSSQYAPPPVMSSSRGRDVSPPRRGRDTPPPQTYVQTSAVDSRPRDRHQQVKPPVASSSRVEDVPPECEQKNKEEEVLQVTLSMPDSYPPPPTLAVAPPVVPKCLPSPPTDFEDDSEDELPREKGKKGGPSIPGHVQDANRLANTSVGVFPCYWEPASLKESGSATIASGECSPGTTCTWRRKTRCTPALQPTSTTFGIAMDAGDQTLH
jgi:hypothetical protein